MPQIQHEHDCRSGYEHGCRQQECGERTRPEQYAAAGDEEPTARDTCQEYRNCAWNKYGYRRNKQNQPDPATSQQKREPLRLPHESGNLNGVPDMRSQHSFRGKNYFAILLDQVARDDFLVARRYRRLQPRRHPSRRTRVAHDVTFSGQRTPSHRRSATARASFNACTPSGSIVK